MFLHVRRKDLQRCKKKRKSLSVSLVLFLHSECFSSQPVFFLEISLPFPRRHASATSPDLILNHSNGIFPRLKHTVLLHGIIAGRHGRRNLPIDTSHTTPRSLILILFLCCISIPPFPIDRLVLTLLITPHSNNFLHRAT